MPLVTLLLIPNDSKTQEMLRTDDKEAEFLKGMDMFCINSYGVNFRKRDSMFFTPKQF